MSRTFKNFQELSRTFNHVRHGMADYVISKISQDFCELDFVISLLEKNKTFLIETP